MEIRYCDFCEDVTDLWVSIEVNGDDCTACPGCYIGYETCPSQCRVCRVSVNFTDSDALIERTTDGSVASLLCGECSRWFLLDQAGLAG